MRQTSRFNFEDNHTPSEPFVLHEYIIEDRGSKYSVSYGRVTGREDIKEFLKDSQKEKSLRHRNPQLMGSSNLQRQHHLRNQSR